MYYYYPMLKEAISVLKEIRSQSNTGDCVIKSLNHAIEYFESLTGSKYTEQEMNLLILEEFGNLFSKFPELQLLD